MKIGPFARIGVVVCASVGVLAAGPVATPAHASAAGSAHVARFSNVTPVTDTTHDATVAVLGRFQYSQLGDKPPGTVRGLINAVVRIPHGTAVFYSLGSTTGSSLNTGIMPTQSLGDPYNIWKFPAWSVEVVDPDGLTLYRPLVTSDRGCLCSSVSDLTKNTSAKFRVGWAVLPALPKKLTSVTVGIADQLVPNVPITSRLPGPASRHAAPLLGKGWPKLAGSAAIKAADTKQATLPMARNTSTPQQSVSSQNSTVSATLNADVLFEFDQATLSASAQSAIADLAKRIDAEAKGTVTITGYTDAVGDPGYNDTLSAQRATAVQNALKPLITNPHVTMESAGRGESDPVASNDTDAGRALNRRVTVVYAKADH